MPSVVRLTLEYDGTAFHGWQKQPNLRTVQGIIEKSLRKLTTGATSVTGAGRTDAGVHATAQAAHFTTSISRSPVEWRNALNALLPSDVSVTSCVIEKAGFNARRQAKEKIYEYAIWNRPVRSPHECRRAWHIAKRLDLPAMRRAARLLVGKHDFTSFASAGSDKRSPICAVRGIRILRNGNRVAIRICGDRFLMHMVRIIVGTLTEVGLGRREPGDIARVLSSHDRSCAGRTGPAQGLCLVRVKFRRRSLSQKKRIRRKALSS